MKSRLTCLLLIALVCLTSCGRRERVIPRGKMAKIYAEMFIADQTIINQTPKLRQKADTSFVYEPIFGKYGYNSADYRASVAYYIKDANRFARILKQSAAIIEVEIRALKKQKAFLEMLESEEGEEELFIPERIYNLTGLGNTHTFGADTLRFYVDSAGGERWFDVRTWMDTAYFGPEMVVAADTVGLADSLAAADSVATVLLDSKTVSDSAGKAAVGEQTESKASNGAGKAVRGKSRHGTDTARVKTLTDRKIGTAAEGGNSDSEAVPAEIFDDGDLPVIKSSEIAGEGKRTDARRHGTKGKKDVE